MKEYGKSPQEDVTINKYALDEECEVSAAKISHWGEKLAQASNEYEAAKAALKLRTSELYLDTWRTEPSMYGLPKFTEDIVKALVAANPEIKELDAKVQSAGKDVATYQAMMAALNSADNNLGRLQKLWSDGYFAKG